MTSSGPIGLVFGVGAVALGCGLSAMGERPWPPPDDAGPAASQPAPAATSTGEAGAADAASDGPAGPFAGAEPYAFNLGPKTLCDGHSDPYDSLNPAGSPCLTCHQFGYGGTVYGSNGQPAPGAEVRILDAQGALSHAYTDAQGNFFFLGRRFAPMAQVGVRDSAHIAVMSGTIAQGDCNACHNGSSTARIQLR